MHSAEKKQQLIQALIDEVSDVDLVCYLAHSGGSSLLKDLFESVRDAGSLREEDLLHNLNLVRQKKIEASEYPMNVVFHRLMHSHRADKAVNGYMTHH